MSRTNFHGPKAVPAVEVPLYLYSNCNVINYMNCNLLHFSVIDHKKCELENIIVMHYTWWAHKVEMSNITKTRLFKYIENFTTKKWKLSDENFSYFSYFC